MKQGGQRQATSLPALVPGLHADSMALRSSGRATLKMVAFSEFAGLAIESLEFVLECIEFDLVAQLCL